MDWICLTGHHSVEVLLQDELQYEEDVLLLQRREDVVTASPVFLISTVPDIVGAHSCYPADVLSEQFEFGGGLAELVKRL